MRNGKEKKKKKAFLPCMPKIRAMPIKNASSWKHYCCCWVTFEHIDEFDKAKWDHERRAEGRDPPFGYKKQR